MAGHHVPDVRMHRRGTHPGQHLVVADRRSLDLAESRPFQGTVPARRAASSAPSGVSGSVPYWLPA
jgi:hypothetical protein